VSFLNLIRARPRGDKGTTKSLYIFISQPKGGGFSERAGKFPVFFRTAVCLITTQTSSIACIFDSAVVGNASGVRRRYLEKGSKAVSV
jgi:hypothetical protein